MRTPRSIAATAIVLAGITGALGVHAAIKRPRPALRHASDSVEDLVARFIDALEARDRRALARLRVDKAEYLRLILPGTTDPGQPPKRYPSDLRRFAWDMLDTKCRYWESTLLNLYGGKKLTLDGFDYREGVKEYAGYTAYRQLSLNVRDPDGGIQELRTGSVVEIDGRYKFVSFIRD
jgi:hypothetical protein